MPVDPSDLQLPTDLPVVATPQIDPRIIEALRKTREEGFHQDIYNGEVRTATDWKPGWQPGSDEGVTTKYYIGHREIPNPYRSAREIGADINAGNIDKVSANDLATFAAANPTNASVVSQLMRDLPNMTAARTAQAKLQYDLSRQGQRAQAVQGLIKAGKEPQEAMALVDQMDQQGLFRGGQQPGQQPAGPPEEPAARPAVPESVRVGGTLDFFLPQSVKQSGKGTPEDLGQFLVDLQNNKQIGQGGIRAMLQSGALQEYIRKRFGSETANKFMELPGAGARIASRLLHPFTPPEYTPPGFTFADLFGQYVRGGKTPQEQALENLYNYTARGIR